MRVLITGAKGILGSALTEILEERKHQPIPVDIDDFDIREKAEAEKWINKTEPDCIVHSAAFTAVDDCERRKEECFKINGEGTGNIAGAAARKRIPLVYISTDFVFDGRKTSPYVETDDPAPLSRYGLSKLNGEREVRRYCDRWTIVRTAWLFGKNGGNFVRTILKKAHELPVLKVVSDQKGCPTYAKDLSEAVTVLMEKECFGVYHVVNSGSADWYELAETVVRMAGYEDVRIDPIKTENLRQPAERPRYSALSTQKLTNDTGLEMRYWKEALKDYLITLGIKIAHYDIAV